MGREVFLPQHKAGRSVRTFASGGRWKTWKRTGDSVNSDNRAAFAQKGKGLLRMMLALGGASNVRSPFPGGRVDSAP